MIMHSIIRAIATAIIIVAGWAAAASAAEIKLLSVNGVKLVLGELAAAFEQATGQNVTISYGEAGVLRKRIEDGEAFDTAILPRAATEQLIKQGKIASGSLVNVIRAPFGMGIRSGAQKPDTSSPDAFKRSLQAARMIVYTDPATGGVSGVFFAGVLEKLSITDEIKQKCKLTAGVLNAQYVASGEADIAVQMKHEIVAVPGIEFVPMPSELTGGVTFTASVGAHATNADAANSLVHFLTGPTAMPLIKAKGMEPG